MAVFAKSTHVTPPERAAFQAIVDAGFADVVRPHTPGPGVYTYWDYYRQRFERNKGMRIDFVLGSPALQGGSPTPSSTGRSGPARAPATTPRSSSSSPTDGSVPGSVGAVRAWWSHGRHDALALLAALAPGVA